MQLGPFIAPQPGIYPGPGKANLLRANQSQYLFQQMLVPAGGSAAANGGNASASIAVQLERIKSAYYPFGCSVQIWFTDVNGNAANPGTFEVDVQTSDIDTDGQYSTTTGGGLTSLNASYSGRVELTLSWAKFLRVYLKTLTNTVYLNALVTR